MTIPKTLRTLLVAGALLMGGTALGVSYPPIQEATAQAIEDDADGGKLNYYRKRGADPYCQDDCDGHRCCKY